MKKTNNMTFFGSLVVMTFMIFTKTSYSSALVEQGSPLSLDMEKIHANKTAPVAEAKDLQHLKKYMARSPREIEEKNAHISFIRPEICQDMEDKSNPLRSWIDFELLSFKLAELRFQHSHTVADLDKTISVGIALMDKIYKDMLDNYRPEYPITPELRFKATQAKRKLFVKINKLSAEYMDEAGKTLSLYYDTLVDGYGEMPNSHIQLENILFNARYASNLANAIFDLTQWTLYNDYYRTHTSQDLWDRLDQMHRCYEAFTAFYWTAESTLLYEVLQGSDEAQSLCDYWHEEKCGIEFHKRSMGFMRRHFMVYAVKAHRLPQQP